MINPEPQTESLDVKPNIKPLSEWSDEKLTRKIATLVGWSNPRTNQFGYDLKMVPPDSTTGRRCGVPDYPSDLNAMHEAEKTLTERQMGDYVTQIKSIVGRDKWPNEYGYFICATARQRAEAFVATLTSVPSPKSALPTKPMDGNKQ